MNIFSWVLKTKHPQPFSVVPSDSIKETALSEIAMLYSKELQQEAIMWFELFYTLTAHHAVVWSLRQQKLWLLAVVFFPPVKALECDLSFTELNQIFMLVRMTHFVDSSPSYLLHVSERAPLHTSEISAYLLQDTPYGTHLYHQLSVPHDKNISKTSDILFQNTLASGECLLCKFSSV